VSRNRPRQRGGQFNGEPYKLAQSEYAGRYGVTILTVKRWWKRQLPCDDPDAMGEFLSNAGAPAQSGSAPERDRDYSDAGDTLAESRINRLDESFLDGEGLVAAIKRINKIEIALADAIRDCLNEPKPDIRALLNRLGAWTQMLEAMRKLEKDTPGILEQHKKQIDIGEVEEGVTRLLLAIVGRLQMLPTRAMQTLAGFSNPQDIRDELEKEIADVLGPIRECEWIPLEHKAAVCPDAPPAATPTPAACAKKTGPPKNSHKRNARRRK
jgi:hypothetical protein